MSPTSGGEALRISMLGTRGVPAAYGGFETAIEEIGSRLAARGHRVTVYCRTSGGDRLRNHLGMSLVHLPALRVKAGETLSHTAFSVAHLTATGTPDVAFVFNAANAPFLPWLRLLGVPTAVHVDGLEWMRAKWKGAGKRYYRLAEKQAVAWADALIADAQGIADYYRRRFDVSTELLSYGAKIITAPGQDRLAELGLTKLGYHLVVARFEPENHVDLILEGYRSSTCAHPLVIVGSAPYSAAYTDRIFRLAAGDERIRLVGGLWDQEQLDQLYANSLSYVHGHSVGGTNPSLLRAMGGGTLVLAYDVEFNREVAGTDGHYFSDPAGLRRLFDAVEHATLHRLEVGQRLQRRATNEYDWDRVAAGYESLARRLAAGYSIHRVGRRMPQRGSSPSPATVPDTNRGHA